MSFCSGKKFFRHRRYTQQKDGAITQTLTYTKADTEHERTDVIPFDKRITFRQPILDYCNKAVGTNLFISFMYNPQ